MAHKYFITSFVLHDLSRSNILALLMLHLSHCSFSVKPSKRCSLLLQPDTNFSHSVLIHGPCMLDSTKATPGFFVDALYDAWNSRKPLQLVCTCRDVSVWFVFVTFGRRYLLCKNVCSTLWVVLLAVYRQQLAATRPVASCCIHQPHSSTCTSHTDHINKACQG